MAFAMVEVATCILLLIILFANPLMCLCRCPPQEYEALLSLNITIAVEDDGSSSIWKGIDIPWANGTDCCEWQGVECDQHNHHVVEIILTTVPYHHSLIGGVISNSLCELPLLTTIHLSNLGITGTLPSCLGNLHYLEELTMDDNMLGGVIPLSICTLTNLKLLRLRGNQLSGNLPFCLNNLSSLSTLDLSGNELSGQIPFTWGDLPLLQVLDFSCNQLSGTLPLSFAGLSSLTTLYANGNKFNESTPSWALPSSIQNLRLSLNELTISENFFHNLTKLEDLSLSNCTLNISISWIPNLQLVILELVSCQMDGQIPPWISTQFSLVFLTLANNGLGGEIPTWLWDMPSLSYLSLSRNHLHGPIFPNGPTSKIRFLDVSSNALSGSIPSGWPSGGLLPILILNDNLFTGNIPPSLCHSPGLPVLKLNLENNKFVGSIPWCLIDDFSPFIEVNLGGNSFEGTMPQGLTVSHVITSLVLRNNQLNGSFLPSFLSDSNLQELDIGHNNFTGHLPKSIVNIPSIKVLVMRDNQFSGNILPEIGELKQLQILDLSSNNLSGPIPHNIVFLQAMTVAREDGYVQAASSPGVVFLMDFYLGELKMTAKDTELMKFALAGLIMTTKGTQLYYPYILSTLTSIDLSNNRLSGDVPLDFGMLKGLRFLNLSMNNLSGIIPQSLGDMSQLESLDLSSNKLCGNIPSELQSLSSLAYLNLSNNNLSGSIPQSGQMITFENTSYFKNPYLHGCPLANNCFWPKFTPPPSPVRAAQVKDDQKSEQFPWYQIGVGWSCGAGFLIVVVLLLSVRESWRERYFKGVDNVLNSLFPFLRNRHL